MKPKFDVVNEQVVLAVAMADENGLKKVFKFIEPSDFLGARHRAIYNALVKCKNAGLEPTNENIAVMVEGEDFGGLEYLKKLRKLKKTKSVEFNIEILRKDSARFHTQKIITKLDERLLSKSFEFDECLTLAREGLDRMKRAPLTKKEENAADVFERRLEKRRQGKVEFVSTGYKRALDTVLTEGFAKGSMTVVAGRPRMGKTTKLVDMVRRQLRKKKKPKILVIPYEKGVQYFLDMLVSSISGVELEDILKYTHEIPDKHYQRVLRASNKVRGFIDDGILTIRENPQIANPKSDNQGAMDLLEAVLAEDDYDIGFYDLFERMLPELEPQKIAVSLHRLHWFGEKYGMHQVVIQQLKRNAESRGLLASSANMSNRPTLTDLKNSGAWEEVADVVLLIHREKVYKPMLARDVIETNVAKQKLGKDMIVMLADYQPNICRLENDRLITVDELVKPRFAWK